MDYSSGMYNGMDMGIYTMIAKFGKSAEAFF
jgi:hypothetical protein